ncbi:lanthionine synthetase LanC family protein [Nocardia sp. NPDC020380]|uniref:lanthionine synthetase LanC family protein n=1 Tax=Nocardia sp. NPDC020380 TaxID=3364309 RepID=UPI00379E7903
MLRTLIRAAETTGDTHVRDAVHAGTTWLVDRIGRDPNPLPGLYFGRAGTAVALYEAGRLLDSDTFREAGCSLLDQVPGEWPNPDVAHGVAGAGFASLLLWSASGQPGFGERVRGCATHLMERAERRNGMLVWPIPDDFDSHLAGVIDYGYAHGTAGIADFLLAAGIRCQEPAWIAMAHEAADTLHHCAVDTEAGALWPVGPRAPHQLLDYWCSGSAGVGTFLLRMLQHSNDTATLRWPERAAEAVWRRRWAAGSSQCHGLAGAGELLLDLADHTADERYRRYADDMAAALVARAGMYRGRLLAPDETGTGFSASYGVGVAGWVDFLLRLRYGGPRSWAAMP